MSDGDRKPISDSDQRPMSDSDGKPMSDSDRKPMSDSDESVMSGGSRLARGAAGRAIRHGLETLQAVGAELRGLQMSGPRARQAGIAAISVVLSVTAALWLHLDMPWWAGISGFMSVQATRPGSLQRALLRVAGTMAGAATALVIAPLCVNDPVAGSVLLFATTTLGMTGLLVSRHAYAWLFFAITNNMVVLLSISDATASLHYAVYRVMEVTLGSATALIAVIALGPDDPAAAAPPVPGWADPLGAQWPALLHAIRTGIVVMLLPWAWRFFELPSLSQMAITVAAVMAVPTLSDHPLENGRAVVERALHRIIGCVLGGIAALLALALSFDAYLPWLALLTVGVWVGAQVQDSQRGVGLIGSQASIVWLLTVVQDWGPPDSLLPGLTRLGGMASGLVILLVVALLLWPAEQAVDMADR